MCENLDTLDEPEARASMIWIIGEYAERIDNADELLESFLDGFQDENTQVQLQLLTAIVKLFLKRPSDTQVISLRIFWWSLITHHSVQHFVPRVVTEYRKWRNLLCFTTFNRLIAFDYLVIRYL